MGFRIGSEDFEEKIFLSTFHDKLENKTNLLTMYLIQPLKKCRFNRQGYRFTKEHLNF